MYVCSPCVTDSYVLTDFMLTYIFTALLNFTSQKYFVMESTGYAEIGVWLSGGTISSALTVTVTLNEQTALGKCALTITMYITHIFKYSNRIID